VDSMPIPDGTLDFGYSLGVLHHIPDTGSALRACVRTLKPGAPFLLYLYYGFDNRPAWFRAIWRGSDRVRAVISRSPAAVKHAICDVLALTVYWPLARAARAAARLGAPVGHIPLSAYRDRSFYVMRTDALDRFGTRLEKRFTRPEIARLMTDAGLSGIRFREDAPFWIAVGRKTG
jgi:SAM-dependent methyltransferase